VAHRIWDALIEWWRGPVTPPLIGQNAWESLEEDPRPEVWSSWPGAVLLQDEIRFYSQHPKYPLIQPFEEKNLKPARYQLTLGDEARIGGKRHPIGSNRPLIIEPHQVAIVKTREHLNIPRFLIARWNLTVDRVYEGLLWVGALQVDPGWVGYLPCPLYNMSDKPVELQYGDKLFTIDFVRTTRFGPGCKPYQRNNPPNPPSLATYDAHVLHSGPYETLRRVDELLDFRNFTVLAITVMVAVLAAIASALGVVALRPTAEGTVVDGLVLISGWPMAALVGSAIAVVLSVGSLALSMYPVWRRRRR
jgi:deoxycytidine triphosphate deaminase